MLLFLFTWMLFQTQEITPYILQNVEPLTKRIEAVAFTSDQVYYAEMSSPTLFSVDLKSG